MLTASFLRRALADGARHRRTLEPTSLASWSSTFSSTCSSSSSSLPSPLPPPSSSRPGLFGLPGLHSPADWARLADDCVAESDRLTAAAAAAPPTAAAVRALDDLSDAVCRVADAAELCRVAAAGAEWRASAAAAAARLGAHVYGLNAHAGMASALAAAMRAFEEEDQQRRNNREQPGSSPSSHSSSFSREASRVGGALLRDFSRSGMFLPTAAARRAASEAEAAAAQASVRFTDALADPEAGGICFNVSYSNSPVAATPAAVAAALRFEPDAGLRRRCYEAAFSTKSTGHLTVPLHATLEARARRAEALGFGKKGWRGMLIDDDDSDETGVGGKRGSGSLLLEASLAGSASTVRSFLLDLAGELRPLAEEQVSQLSRAKKRSGVSGGGEDSSLQPWDIAFFSAKVRAEAAAAAAASASGGLLSSASPAPASPQVPVEDAVGGMLDVLEAAVGVRLVRAPLGEGEGWAPGVAKFVAVDVGSGEKRAATETSSSSSLDKIDPARVLGDVYLDLAPRPAKFPGAAHFTLRCGRSNSFLGSDGGGGGGGERNNGKALAASRPAVAIVASFSGLRERREENNNVFSSSPSSSPPPLPWLGSMAWSETTTLLHEGGHALHSLLSRTEFQHLSGTRGPLDVVELPSHVAEWWARLPAGGGGGGAGSVGGHASAAGAAAAALATRGRVSRLDFVSAEAARRATAALDFLGQVTDALVDAELHRGAGSGGERFSAEAAAADAAALIAAVSPLPQPPSSSSSSSPLSSFSPHARFGHLAGYGGAYYSYVYAECVAADVCARLRGGKIFSETGTGGGQRDLDLLTRRALRAGGEALRESLLRHGCSAPPREAVRDLLERSSGGVVGCKKAEGGSSRGGGWRPDPTARLAEVVV